jgi:phasin family protein
MINTPEQFVQMNKAAFETFQTMALKSIESFEKFADLNIQATKASLSESTEQVKALLSAKDAKAFADIASGAAQPAADKVTAYAKHVYEIANDAGTEIAKLFEKQLAEGNKQLNSAIDALAKNAPAGSEGVVTFVKQAVSAASSAFDQVNKATKQAVELAEANIAAAGKAAPRARKAS